MSIDAIVVAVHLYENGGGKLKLEDRPPKRRGDSFGCAGQSSLEFTDEPEEVTALNGVEIWGGDGSIVLGETIIAYRRGYTKIEFCSRDVFVAAVKAYHQRRIAQLGQ